MRSCVRLNCRCTNAALRPILLALRYRTTKKNTDTNKESCKWWKQTSGFILLNKCFAMTWSEVTNPSDVFYKKHKCIDGKYLVLVYFIRALTTQFFCSLWLIWQSPFSTQKLLRAEFLAEHNLSFPFNFPAWCRRHSSCSIMLAHELSTFPLHWANAK